MLLCFQALDLKPNYVRAWANMGISYANQVILLCNWFLPGFLRCEMRDTIFFWFLLILVSQQYDANMQC
jgi:hypothetical protein